MRKKYFLDTNILVYAIDMADKKKREIAKGIVAKTGAKGVISTQVLQEFYVAAIRKLNISPLRAKELILKLSGFQSVQITQALIYQAIDTMILNQISFWDALIVVAAIDAQCTTILSEDLNPGQSISGIKVENPFSANWQS